MKDSYKLPSGETITRELVVFEAENVNDPSWELITKILKDCGMQVMYGNGNYMNIIVKTEIKR